MEQQIKLATESMYDEIVHHRRTIHAHPELAFEETETGNYVKKVLEKHGIETIMGVAKTGLLGIIYGNNTDKYIALRADMDALPIQEENDVAYKSKLKGKMHACGHDAHTAALLGAAGIIQQNREKLKVNVLLIFQPSEEKLPGGAKVILEEGILQKYNPIAVFGQHVYPELPPGKIGVKPEKYMASADEIYIDIIGKGGHAALPHQTLDPIPVAAEVILSLQKVISRNCDPLIPAVLSFGKVIADGATNIIPGKVRLEGTFRTFDEDWRYKAHQLIRKQTEHICKAHGVEANVDIQVGYPYVHNNLQLTAKFKDAAIQFLGKENVIDLEMRMTAEDFAYYSQAFPACFYRFGTGHPGAKLHRPDFNIEEDSLKTAAGLMAWLAFQDY